jgi:hypothetical protein
MTSKFQKTPDNAAVFMSNTWRMKKGMFFLIIFFICAVFISFRLSPPDDTTTNVVRIRELNPLLKEHPEIPFIEPIDDFYGHYNYGRFSSIKKAEDWLLDNGYKCRIIPTTDMSRREFPSYKTFAVKGEPGSPTESVVMLIAEHGRGDPHLIPFRYPEGESPVNWSRFDRIDVPKGYARADTGEGSGTHCVLPFRSTHNSGPNFFLRITSDGDWPIGSWSDELLEEMRVDRAIYNKGIDKSKLGEPDSIIDTAP